MIRLRSSFFVLNIIFGAIMMFCSNAVASEFGPLYPGYPGEYDSVGIVDAVDDNRFVINDSTYRFTAATTFHGPGGTMNRDGFKTGDKVGIILADKRLIGSLWFMKAGERVIQSSEKQKGGTSTIRKEGGVWKN